MRLRHAMQLLAIVGGLRAGGAQADSSATGLFLEAVRRGLPQDGVLLVVDVSAQRASFVTSAGLLVSWPVSTALAGTGSQAGSNKTPLGWHRISERFGDGAPLGTLFQSRRATGRVFLPAQCRAPSPAEDAVLTRVLWLDGLEPGRNRGPGIDSHERCIYVHGTNQEQLLGSPASHGCIRMSNRDVRRFFDLTEGAECWVLIVEAGGPAVGERAL